MGHHRFRRICLSPTSSILTRIPLASLHWTRSTKDCSRSNKHYIRVSLRKKSNFRWWGSINTMCLCNKSQKSRSQRARPCCHLTSAQWRLQKLVFRNLRTFRLLVRWQICWLICLQQDSGSKASSCPLCHNAIIKRSRPWKCLLAAMPTACIYTASASRRP